MSLSRDEQAALEAMETALREQDPELSRTLATFTHPPPSCWLRAVVAGLLVLTPAVLAFGFAGHSKILIALGALLMGSLFTTIAVAGGFAAGETAVTDDPECGNR